MAQYPMQRKPMVGGSISAGWGDGVISSIAAQRPVVTPGVRISKGPYGTRFNIDDIPTATQTVGQPQALKPFAVQWIPGANEGEGDWAIYLPLGCATVEQDGLRRSYLPINEKANDAEGKEVFQWYKIAAPQNADATAGYYNDYPAKQWTVYVHMKPWPRMKVSTIAEDTDYGQVKWVVAAANIYEVDLGEGKVERGATQLHFDAVEKEWDASGDFAIRYTLNDYTQPNSAVKVELVNQSRMIGRVQFPMQEANIRPVNIKGWMEVYLFYSHPAESVTLEVKGNNSAGDQSDDNHTIFKIYRLKDDVVIEDLRSTIPAMDFYTLDTGEA